MPRGKGCGNAGFGEFFQVGLGRHGASGHDSSYPMHCSPRPLLAVLLLITGCSCVEYNSTNSPRMVVVADRTPFFHNGPAQANGPDNSLIKGELVDVLRREVGYSLVRVEDGQNGYVANDALEPAPVAKPVPKASPSPQAKSGVKTP